MTSFDIVEDRALTLIDDYKITNLYNRDIEAFKKWCDGFLLSAVPNFIKCKQSLEYNKIDRYFLSDLSDIEISILADFWVIEWFRRETQDSTKINVLLQTSGSFKTHAAAPNINAKSTYLDGLREKVYQKINYYLLQDPESISV